MRASPLLLILCGLLAAGCQGSESSSIPSSSASTAAFVRTVAVVRPMRQTVVKTITLPGDLVGYYEAALHSKVTGYLSKVNVDKGDWVKRGEVLADIEVPELAQNLARARATQEITRLTWERLDKVRKADPKLIAKEEVDIAYSKYKEAEAAVGELDAITSYTQIVAPFDGVITGRFADPGALIRAGGGDFAISGSGVALNPSVTEGAGGHLTGGGPVLSEARLDKLRVYIYVPEREASQVTIGMPATLALRALPGEKFHAEGPRFASSLDLATRTMLTEIDIPNPDHRLYPRMYADVNLVLARHINAIEIPRGAVYGIGQESAYVFIVADDKLRKVGVTTGISDGINVEITSGLTGNEKVVRDTSASFAAGDPVRAQEEAISQANSQS